MTSTVREALANLSDSRLDLSLSLVSALKSAASSFSLSSGEQLHSIAFKSGLHRSNLYVSNALIHLYARCGQIYTAHRLFFSAALLSTASWNILLAAHLRCPNPDLHLDNARSLFGRMPHKDRVSFTTMIMALAKHGSAAEAVALFRDMMAAGVTPNEVTLAAVISSCSRIDSRAAWMAKASHAAAAKCGLDGLLLVATNLVHGYAVSSNFDDAEALFAVMPEKNTVTWNVLLKGYAKAGCIKSARSVFDRIPEKDTVSWGTLIDGYLLAGSLEGALLAFREMLQEVESNPNEVMLVNLVSSCSLCTAIATGQQLHAVILKAGLDFHPFVQTTLIHLYSECSRIDLALLQFRCGSKNLSSWNAMIAGFIQNNEMTAARQMFDEMPDRDVVSWSTMIAGYAQCGHHDAALTLFREMRRIGMQPNEITLVSALSAVAGSTSLEEGKWVLDYINNNSVPLTDNLCASLIDMHAKCGSIQNSIVLFNSVRETYAGISSWNAIICGLAMHGHADASLALFSGLLKTRIKPNSITFIGVLSACCHSGLVAIGRQYFDSIRSVYGLQPSIKHYGCMVDLLGRAGHLEEAEEVDRIDADGTRCGHLG
ncbi:Pentatricopeptide repeat-containing protein [Platanthera zijinensis]|uniref:Pentatricopeptide repeat-containing protein n=1 Tax=Platanthera zijinensis TaxID=2320716 RepID=A0AAP0GEN9_9ASPA